MAISFETATIAMTLGIIVFVLCLAFLLGNLYLLKDLSSSHSSKDKRSASSTTNNTGQPPSELKPNGSDAEPADFNEH